MAKEIQDPETPQPAEAQPQPEKKSSLKKYILLIGVPLFLLQVATVYFLTTKFVYPAASHRDPAAPVEESKTPAESEEQQIFVVKDLIINPAGTNGTRFLLTTVGFEASTPESKQELEKKELQIRDLLNTVLASKGLEELVDTRQKEKLRGEITVKTNEMLNHGKLRNVYFSKFIIQ